MEYSSFTLQGGVTSKLTCSVCNIDEINIQGKIKYAFFFLEFLPFVPTQKELILTCNKCQHQLDNNTIDTQQVKSIKRKLFKLYLLVPMYAGLILSLLALGYWQYQIYQDELLTQEYIASPKVNDFYFIDYRGVTQNLRPSQRYRVAKVTVVNADQVSVVYSRYFYPRISSIENALKGGMIVDSRYFNKKEHVFTAKQRSQYYDDNVLLEVKRPHNNRLYGNYILNEVTINKQYKYLSKMYNDQGLAFMSHSEIEGNIEQAQQFFIKSAQLGFSKGQVNLAKLYLLDNNTSGALQWLERASLQGNQDAIILYLQHCKVSDGCFKNSFVREMKTAGYEVSLE